MRVLSRLGLLLAASASVLVLWAAPAFAVVTLVQISQDTFTNPTSQHKTQVEPDSFSFGSTIVSVVQTGRFFDGGASDIAFATSHDNGATWTTGNLPGITVFAGGPYDRVSDPAVAYDAQDDVWLVSTLALTEAGGVSGAAVLTSRSTDGGLTWSNPVTTATGGDVDKNWIVCDNTASSPFYGNCYTQWDVFSLGDRIKMSTSTDGGLTWGAAKSPKGNPAGLGGQPVVQPNGTVIVPIANAFETAVGAFRSTDGGNSWSRITTISSVPSHTVAGGLRSGPLPSAEIDAAGKVYVVWQDCRFRSGCTANDIVMSTSTNGTSWTAVARIPIDATTSDVDHFIPGLAVDKTTSGATAHLGLTYYYYPATSCTFAMCQLDVGFISSTNGGSTWSAPTQLAGPMQLAWIADTSQGRMVGDYISTSYGSDGLAHPFFAVGVDPTGTGFAFDEALYTTSTGLTLAGGATAGELWPGGSPATAPGADNRHYRLS
jgi:hypothetical protein